MSPQTITKANTETAQGAASPANVHAKIEHTNRLLQTVSLAIGILGACGTLFVWFAANLYTGSVEIKSDKPVQSLTVKAYNEKGAEATFRTEKFELMPGRYHMEISADGVKPIEQDVQIHFHKTVTIAVAAPATTIQTQAKHHWWQIWKKSSDQEGETP